MLSSKILCTFLLVAGVAACSREQPPASEAELMRAVFAERYNAKPNQALAMIPVKGAQAYHIMSPVTKTDLPDGRTVLIVNGSPSDEQGVSMAAHASSGMLNVYILQREGAQWKVTERRENVDMLGSSGDIGEVKWVTLGPGKPGFIVSHGGIWQGYWIRFAAVYALDGGLRSVGSFLEGSGNEGACMPETDKCWVVQGDIHFAAEPQKSGYQDIVVDFNDKRYTVEQVQSQTKQTARYHFDGKKYVLVSGTNPVPGI